MTKQTIVIDAGHGGKDPGAINGTYKEADAALDISYLLAEELIKKGYKAIMTRSDDTFIELYDRCKISNYHNADLFISIHLNASTNKSAYGIETWCHTNSIRGNQFASIVQNALIGELQARDRGVKQSSGLCVLKHTKAPAILIETGFISNDDERKKLFDSEYQKQIIKAIIRAIDRFFEV